MSDVKIQYWIRKYRIAPEYADCKNLEEILDRIDKKLAQNKEVGKDANMR